jgi:hypothetical protein
MLAFFVRAQIKNLIPRIGKVVRPRGQCSVGNGFVCHPMKLELPPLLAAESTFIRIYPRSKIHLCISNRLQNPLRPIFIIRLNHHDSESVFFALHQNTLGVVNVQVYLESRWIF